MIERFFLYGIHAKAAGSAIGGEHHLITLSSPNKTQTLLPLV
jgi:hypothetical protein